MYLFNLPLAIPLEEVNRPDRLELLAAIALVLGQRWVIVARNDVQVDLIGPLLRYRQIHRVMAEAQAHRLALPLVPPSQANPAVYVFN
ncbi:MAG TPA: hypothetical protein VLS96_06960 [Nodosilinea sp.]|nr:hypothetical protein [Nodosilinea sp.]